MQLSQRMRNKYSFDLAQQGAYALTPKAERVQELRDQGNSFDEAFAIADREFTPDGLLLRRGVTSLEAALSGGLHQMGEVQF